MARVRREPRAYRAGVRGRKRIESEFRALGFDSLDEYLDGGTSPTVRERNRYLLAGDEASTSYLAGWHRNAMRDPIGRVLWIALAVFAFLFWLTFANAYLIFELERSWVDFKFYDVLIELRREGWSGPVLRAFLMSAPVVVTGVFVVGRALRKMKVKGTADVEALLAEEVRREAGRARRALREGLLSEGGDARGGV